MKTFMGYDYVAGVEVRHTRREWVDLLKKMDFVRLSDYETFGYAVIDGQARLALEVYGYIQAKGRMDQIQANGG